MAEDSNRSHRRDLFSPARTGSPFGAREQENEKLDRCSGSQIPWEQSLRYDIKSLIPMTMWIYFIVQIISSGFVLGPDAIPFPVHGKQEPDLQPGKKETRVH